MGKILRASTALLPPGLPAAWALRLWPVATLGMPGLALLTHRSAAPPSLLKQTSGVPRE